MSNTTRTRVLFALAAVCLLTAIAETALHLRTPKSDAPRSVYIMSACGRIESVSVTMESGRLYSMEERHADCAEPIGVTWVPVLEGPREVGR